MDQYAVFGNPIAQSKSPLIHKLFAQQTGQRLEYGAILAPLDGFVSSLEEFFALPEAKGCNITMPFKEQAASWVDDLSEGASLAGAVNTIIKNENGRYVGDNTDGEGLVVDLIRQGAAIPNANILLIGAGGAARGVLVPLLSENPNTLKIANRTFEKAQRLTQLINDERVEAVNVNDLNNAAETFDIIINSTSTSLSGELPPITNSVYSGAGFAYDMVYAKEPTAFMLQAEKMGVIKTSDGLGMLVGQAAQSFYLWRDIKPDVEPVLHKLRAQI